MMIADTIGALIRRQGCVLLLTQRKQFVLTKYLCSDRYNRGQSPLVLRRNLLEYGQSASGSPIPARRYNYDLLVAFSP